MDDTPSGSHYENVALFFSLLISLPAFLSFENRDPFQMKQHRDMLYAQYGGNSWDFYADSTYVILAQEEEEGGEEFGNEDGFFDDDMESNQFFHGSHKMKEED